MTTAFALVPVINQRGDVPFGSAIAADHSIIGRPDPMKEHPGSEVISSRQWKMTCSDESRHHCSTSNSPVHCVREEPISLGVDDHLSHTQLIVPGI
jgi:hypothetical protein